MLDDKGIGNMRLSFVVPVLNDAKRLAICLEAIGTNRHASATLEVIVVDNGSTDESASVARSRGARVLDAPESNVADMRNRGAALATGEILAFVDADNVIGSDWISPPLRHLSRPDVAAVGALCLAPASGTWVQTAYDRIRSRPSGVREVEWLGAGNLAVRRNVFLEIGGFDTSLETCEDVDLCNRMRHAGYRLLSDSDLTNIHLGDPTTIRALFVSELWRGRDNVRVTLRGPLTLRALPSVVMPVFTLACLATPVIGAFAEPRGGLWLTGFAACGVLATAILRAARMAGNDAAAAAWTRLPQNLVVGLVYEVARAFALIASARHRTRRERVGG
jgi:GT2 family glycosyltransferase